MSIPANSGAIYTDVSGLTALKSKAARDPNAALQQTAEQFEALFLHMMLKSMRQTSLGDGIMDSDQSRFYQEMFDQQIAMDLAKKRQIGIADMLIKQLGPAQTEDEPTAAAESFPLDLERLRLHRPISPVAINAAAMPVIAATATAPEQISETVPPAKPESDAPAPKPVKRENSVAAVETKSATPITGFDSPKDFVDKLWPLAQKHAAELGVEPRVLLAQAALETGWGKHVSRYANGQSTHNLFNIKADGRWNGAKAVVPTLEYEQGRAVRQFAAFRSYPSFEASFEDYVRFLKQSPRYQEALNLADDSAAFVEALHDAGYATDPLYSKKINRIMNGEHFERVAQAVKGAADGPLT